MYTEREEIKRKQSTKENVVLETERMEYRETDRDTETVMMK